MSKKYNEDLDALLDSLVDDGSLDRKIEGFSQSRHKQEEPEIVIEAHQELLDEEPVKDAGGTRVFKTTGPARNPEPESGTVIINDNEIQQLIDEERGPRLQRVKSGTKKKKPKSTDWKPFAIAAAAVGIVVLGGLLIFGISKVASGLFNPADKTEQLAADFNRLKDFANAYSSDKLSSITAYESIWNKLDADQREEINTLLKERTGKTFAEILAQAKAEKNEAETNTTEIAEKKAQLKKQISQLQSQLTSAQSQLSGAQKEINAKLQAYNDAQAAYNQAQTDLSTAQANLATAQANAARIKEIDSQIAYLTSSDYDDDDEAINLQNQVSALIAEKTGLQGSADVAGAQNAVNSAQSAFNTAQSALDTAKSEYDSVSGNADGYQSTVDGLNSQIADLQSQLDALN